MHTERNGFPCGCLLFVLAATSVGCATTRFPWPATAPAATAGRADVVTLNANYRRLRSQVLVRKIVRPTRANLDWAAYHANFMNADPAPEGQIDDHAARLATDHPFGGVMATGSLTGSVAATALTPDERNHALALAPLLERLLSQKIDGATRLEDAVAKIRTETWGLGGGPQLVRQTATEAFVHDPGAGRPLELWLKIEFAPWFDAHGSMPDEDGDGVPEIYGRLAPEAIGPLDAIAAYARGDYESRVLSEAEVKAWAHQLASYWYPSYNTDLVAPPTTWPTADTDPLVRAELAGQSFASPSVVVRGKPQGSAVYNVFLVEGAASAAPLAQAATVEQTLDLPTSRPSPEPDAIKTAIEAELAAHGGSWKAWTATLAKLYTVLHQRIERIPAGAKALAGGDGFLFFRNSIAYVLGGDLAEQKGDRNPLPVIVEFQRMLAARGVDFLFVPVPTKVEIFPDKTAAAGGDARLAAFAGQVVNPFERKLLLDLATLGVETVDLLPALLAERRAAAPGETLYQKQDTHWTAHGLELAARAIAERIRRYPWYGGIASKRRAYTVRDESFTRHGDLYNRLPEAERTSLSPETLVGHQVVSPDGSLYEDDPQSPIVVLGDSFTGVYHLMDCEHAGVSAHIAKEIGYPVDLLMSYGGGPNVREKLVKRGLDKLGGKKLVIWMMTARDLYDHADGWQPLKAE